MTGANLVLDLDLEVVLDLDLVLDLVLDLDQEPPGRRKIARAARTRVRRELARGGRSR